MILPFLTVNSNWVSKTSSLCGRGSSLPAWCISTRSWSRWTTWSMREGGSSGCSWRGAGWMLMTTKNTLESISARFQPQIWKVISIILSTLTGWLGRSSLRDPKTVEILLLALLPGRISTMDVLLHTGEKMIFTSFWEKIIIFQKPIWQKWWKKKKKIIFRYVWIYLGCLWTSLRRSAQIRGSDHDPKWNNKLVGKKPTWIFPSWNVDGAFQQF